MDKGLWDIKRWWQKLGVWNSRWGIPGEESRDARK
jgi:hypothetical protein